MVFAEDAKWFLPLYQCEEVICHSFTIEEVVHAQQEVPEGQRVGDKVHLTVLITAANYVLHSQCLQLHMVDIILWGLGEKFDSK